VLALTQCSLSEWTPPASQVNERDGLQHGWEREEALLNLGPPTLLILWGLFSED